MPQLKNYYFDLFHHDVEPIVNSSGLWGLHGEYVIDLEHVSYTNWLSDEGELQAEIPNGEDVVLHLDTSGNVALDMDIVAHAVEIGAQATLTMTDNRSLRIVDCFTLNGVMSVNYNHSLTNAGDELSCRPSFL